MSAIVLSREPNRSMSSHCSSSHWRGRPRQSSQSCRAAPSLRPATEMGRVARAPGILTPYASWRPLGEIAGYPLPAPPASTTVSDPVSRSRRKTSPFPSRTVKYVSVPPSAVTERCCRMPGPRVIRRSGPREMPVAGSTAADQRFMSAWLLTYASRPAAAAENHDISLPRVSRSRSPAAWTWPARDAVARG